MIGKKRIIRAVLEALPAVSEKQIEFYIHGVMARRKYELMNRNKKCSFEMDIPLEMDCMIEKKDVTMRYKCVMGTADITFLEGEEKQNAIDHIIMSRYNETRNFDYNRKMVAVTASLFCARIERKNLRISLIMIKTNLYP